MKVKRIALFGLLAAALTSAASAQTTIRITGSTAFRSGTHEAIRNILQPGFTYGYNGAAFPGAGTVIFIGTTKAPTNTSVIIKCFWTGAVGGTKALTQNSIIPSFFQTPDQDGILPDNTVTTSTTGVSGLTTGAGNLESGVADIAMSDQFQNSTEFRTPVLQSRPVGVVPFQWIRNNGAPIGISNMTPLLAASLLSGGLPLSQFTGIPADSLTAVWGTGRDEDSGTRLVTYAESAYGIFSSPAQYQLVNNGTTITDIVPWPINTVLGTTYPVGHSGYGSGGTLVGDMNKPGSITSANPGWVVSYAGVSDAGNVVPGTAPNVTATISGGGVTALNLVAPGFGGTLLGASTTVTFSGGGPSVTTPATATPQITNGIITGFNLTPGAGYTVAPTVTIRGGGTLAWNGVTYSPTAVREGQYTFWGYEFLTYRSGYAQAAIAIQLADQIKNTDAAVAGILLSTMHVGRQVEGGPVTPGNPFP